jgi:hypothetical protein
MDRPLSVFRRPVNREPRGLLPSRAVRDLPKSPSLWVLRRYPVSTSRRIQ